MDEAALDSLITEAGSLDDRILVCLKTQDGRHAIRFEDSDVLAEWDDARQRLVLSVEIGTPPRDRAGHIYETLLSYNLLWATTGGVHMALTGRKGAVVQVVDLAGAEMEPRQVAIVAVNLASLATIWRAYFESEDGDDDDETTPPPSFSMADMIRA